MGRLVWTRTGNGWRSGRYTIDLIAPEMWALVVDGPGSRAVPRLISTSASLKCLEHQAQRREWRRWRTLRLMRNALGAATALAGFALLSFLPPAWSIVAGVAATVVMMRSVAVMATTVTQASWTRVSQTYQ